MTDITYLSNPGSATHPNEDAVAVSHDGRVAAICDGLTSKESHSNHFRFLGRGPQHPACLTAATPVEALNAARQIVLQAFNQLAQDQPTQQAEFPMAAVGLIRRLDDGRTEITRVGDIEICIFSVDAQGQDREVYLAPDPVHRYYEDLRSAEAKRLAAEEGITDKAQQRRRILPMMHDHYNRMTNVQGGFGVFSLGRDLIEDVVQTVYVPTAALRDVHMYTDGLAKWFDIQATPLPRTTRDVPDLSEMVSCVRQYENDSTIKDVAGSGFKKNDDATGLRLRLRPA